MFTNIFWICLNTMNNKPPYIKNSNIIFVIMESNYNYKI